MLNLKPKSNKKSPKKQKIIQNDEPNATKEGDEEEIPLGVTIHVMEEDALGAKNGGGILKLRTPSQIREEIEQKIPFLAGKNNGARGLRINFKFDGIDGSNDSDSGAIETLYRNV